MRLDQYVFELGLTPSREKARAHIMAGEVYVDGQKATKAGTQVPQGAAVELRTAREEFVSRGGHKLQKAFEAFGLEVDGRVCMDVGASSGGFTDCLLRHGAKLVYAVDVGYGQLDWKLRSDPRVVVRERTNIRHVTPEQFDPMPSFFTVDVSFISLRQVLPVLAQITRPEAAGVCLVKPQFEAGREQVGKHGVVREPKVHLAVLCAAVGYAAQNGFSVCGVSYSPIKGPKGNIEFLLYLRKESASDPIGDRQLQEVVDAAGQALAD